MPLYEYECTSCKKTHEVMQKFSDPPLEKCPDCGKPVTKLMSLSSFALKGAGWYTTDYKKSGAPAKAETPAKPEAPGKSEAAAKPEAPAKPAAPEKPKKSD